MKRVVTFAALLASFTLFWVQPAWADGPSAENRLGEDVFNAYCGSCHGSQADGRGPRANAQQPRPADLRMLRAHLGSPLPRNTLARHIDPAPDTLGGRHDEICNRALRVAFHDERFAWNVRRGTLFEILGFLEGVQR
jgi:hypothetical protein